MSRFLNQDFINEVIAKNDIVSVISKYVNLTRRGNNYWACCPFHMEKTPSMSIKAEDQFFKCFGCGVGGNVIQFIMQIENVDFIKAIEILCKNAGMEMPTLQENSEMQTIKKHRDTLLNILLDSSNFYISNLNNPKGEAQLSYIKKRALNQEMIKKFKIGISLDYNSLPRYLLSKGYSKEDIVEAGVVGKNADGNLYDFYGTRVVFPIFNGLGEVVGFSGRDISQNPEKAKYKNTPQTMLFNKSGIIYGYNFLRELKRNHELDSIILVEGQMDVIACHQAGITNAIGCLGTALTATHAKDLQHLCPNIILCLDGDNAGANATYKAMGILRDANMNVSVVRLTGAKDPDEFIKKFGKDQFLELLSNAMNYMEFILIDLAKKYDLGKNNEKNDYINEALKYFSSLSTASEQEIYLGVLKEIVNVPIDALRRTLTGAKPQIKQEEKQADDKEMVVDGYTSEAKTLILASLLYKRIASPSDYQDIFEANDEFKEVFEYLKQKQDRGENVNISTTYSEFDITPDSAWDKVINYNFPEDAVFKNYLNESLNRLRLKLIKDKRARLTESLKNIKDLTELHNVVSKIKEIDETILKINKK